MSYLSAKQLQTIQIVGGYSHYVRLNEEARRLGKHKKLIREKRNGKDYYRYVYDPPPPPPPKKLTVDKPPLPKTRLQKGGEWVSETLGDWIGGLIAGLGLVLLGISA